jgi:biotin operon repressor
MLYLYLASNKNEYVLALSPAAIKKAIGMARSTYYDQLDKLIKKGYLVQTSGNGYEFYEVSQIPKEEIKNSTSSDGLDFCECANAVQGNTPSVQPIPASNIEINKTNIINKPETNISGLPITKELHIPEVKEVHTTVPQRKPKKEGFKF